MTLQAPAPSIINQEYFDRLAVSGDLKPGLELLRQFADVQLSLEQLELKRKYLARFDGSLDDGAGSDFVFGLIRVYENYWSSVLSQRVPFAAAENRLLAHLKDVFLNHAPRSLPNLEMPIDQIEKLIGRELESRGLKSHLGRTQPYRDLVIWRSEGPVGSVKDMVDVLSSGWLGFATFDNLNTWSKGN